MIKASSQAPWPDGVLEGISRILGDTELGLTGSEIEALLQQTRIADPGGSKRQRIHGALAQRQAADGAPGAPAAFVVAAMAPARYVQRREVFSRRQDELSEVLSFVGLRVLDDGRLGVVSKATSLAQAAEHANALRAELERRGTHPLVLQACRTELLAEDTFHALLEALKGVFDRLRELTGHTTDGGHLVSAVLDGGRPGKPVLMINGYATQSDKSEQTGFANVVRGLGGLYRNPVAHDLRRKRSVSDAELLEALTAVSMVHRRLDTATLNR